MLSGDGWALVVEVEARWKTAMEDKRGIPHSFPVEFVQNIGPSLSYVEINNTQLSSPHAQKIGNNK